MVPIGLLWLPILVSALLVFLASSLFWMVIRHHDSDWKAIPGEEAVLDALRKSNAPRGQYRFPYAPARQMQSPEMAKKIAEGPSGFLFYWNRNDFSMGRTLGLWFLYLLAVSILVAYLSGRVLAVGAISAAVFRVAGTAAILAYVGAIVPKSIWWGQAWSMTLKEIFDGVVYGLLTGAAFCWLWPR